MCCPWGVGAYVWYCRKQVDGTNGERLGAYPAGARDYLREVALADLGCAVLGVFVAAQIRFGSNVTSTYLALSLALPVLWIAPCGWPGRTTSGLSGPARTSTARC